MKRRLAAGIIVAVVALTAVAAPVAAQTTNTTDEDPSRDVLISVDENVEVADISVANETAYIDVRSTRQTTTVVATDASVTLDGPTDITRTSAIVTPGSPATLAVELEQPGSPAVTVATSNGIVGWGESSSLFSGAASWRDVRASAIGGALAGSLPGIAIAVRRLRRDRERVEEVI